MKEGEEEKTKTYSALIWTDKAIQKEDIAFLDDIKVSVALLVYIVPVLVPISRVYLHAATDISLSLCFFSFFVWGSSCHRDFHTSLPHSYPSLLHHCHASNTGGWLLAKTTNNYCIISTSQ